MAGLVNSAMPQQAAPAPQAQAGQPSVQQNAQGAQDNYQPPQNVEQPGSALQNPELNKIESGVEGSLKPEQKQMYQSIVLAAMRLAFDPQTHGKLMEGLQSSPDIGKNISLIVAGMMGIIYNQVQPDPNQFLPAAIPASITMMCQLMEFAERTGMGKFDSQTIAKTTADTSQAVLAKFGVDKNKIQQAANSKDQNAQQATLQPQGQQLAAGQPAQPQPQAA